MRNLPASGSLAGHIVAALVALAAVVATSMFCGCATGPASPASPNAARLDQALRAPGEAASSAPRSRPRQRE